MSTFEIAVITAIIAGYFVIAAYAWFTRDKHKEDWAE